MEKFEAGEVLYWRTKVDGEVVDLTVEVVRVTAKLVTVSVLNRGCEGWGSRSVSAANLRRNMY